MTATPRGPLAAAARPRLSRWLVWLTGTAAAVAAIVLLWNLGSRLINGQDLGAWSYVVIASLVFGDAICALLPGETTINAGAVLAANGQLDIGLVILAGAVGAVTGDSCLYWIARRARGRPQRWMDRTASAESSKRVLNMLDRNAGVVLVFGRYIPGVRFALNVTLGGVVRMPYPRFLRWSALSGTLWATYTGLMAYSISSALDGYPLASLVITTLVSSTLIAGIVWLQQRLRRNSQAESSP